MMEPLDLEYYYGNEAVQFQFYPVPVELFVNPCYEKVSTDAKLLYGIMLSLLHLSRKNGWIDEEGRAYIRLTLRTIKLKMKCERDKAMKLLKELDVTTGIGLIEKRRIKEGEAPRIYVKNFCKMTGTTSGLIVQKREDTSGLLVQKQSDSPEEPVEKNDGVGKTDRSEKPTTTEKATGGGRINRPEGVEKTDPNYIDFNNMESNNIRVFQSGSSEKQSENDVIDPMDEIRAYTELVKKNIGYEQMTQRYQGNDLDLYETIFRVICHVVCGKGKKYHKVGNLHYPHEVVKSVFLKLDQTHIGIVMEGYQDTATKVTDMGAYLTAALYNAYLTGDLYWDRRVKHDMYGGGWEENGIVNSTNGGQGNG